MDYSKVGLKSGIEIHQQLDTHKLFCSCPSIIRDDKPHYTIKRKLRAVAGELGHVDPAALYELLKNQEFIYEGYDDTNCLVELDEEPPHLLNKEALTICLEIAFLLNAKPVDELQIMRKTVIDGSNTSGFQRTALVATDGYVEVNGKRIGIPSICIEEDACRIIKKEGNTTTYRLDRLGIPLVEITTDPDIESPQEAREVAKRIGSILRATGKVKRGLGTIRQDLNISIRGGERIEVKGVQQLNDIPKLVENEIKRQQNLLEIKKKLRNKRFGYEFFECTDLLGKTDSKIIRSALKAKKGVFGVKLNGFSGLLGVELMPNHRFGTELAQVAKGVAGVKGIFHSDELPAYGITKKDVDAIKNKIQYKAGDAFVLVVESEKVATEALEAIVERCRTAFLGVPKETRRASGEKTEFMRPLPGSARMYPETDEPLVKIARDTLKEIKKNLPKLPEERIAEVKEMGLNSEMANQLVNSDLLEKFLDYSKKFKINPTLIVSTLMAAPKEAEKKYGVDCSDIPTSIFEKIFYFLEKRKIAKESIPEILAESAKDPKLDIQQIIESKKLFLLTETELKNRIKEIIENNKTLASQGKTAIGPLMGQCMAQLRGKADASTVSRILNEML